MWCRRLLLCSGATTAVWSSTSSSRSSAFLLCSLQVARATAIGAQSRHLVSVSACSTEADTFTGPYCRPRLLSATSTENGLPCLYIAKRYLAKGKDRKKEKKTDRPKVILDDEDMEKVMAFEDFKLEVEAIIDELKTDLKLNYNARLNPRQIESLEISYDGVKVALADIVTIARKPQELVINLTATPNALKPTMNAIIDSGMNLNPQQDGNIIYIRLPKVTTEHRQALIKSVKAAGQKAKDKLKDRNFHKKFYHKDVKKLSQDLQADATANLNFYIKQRSALIDEIVDQKAASLLN